MAGRAWQVARIEYRRGIPFSHMDRYIALALVLLVSVAASGWMAFNEARKDLAAEKAEHATTEALLKASSEELNELRSTVAAGGMVEF